MGFLDTYTTKLTPETAAHLLRRATFGPTQQEISDFVGKTASEAVDILINNASYRASPPPPVEMDETRSDAGQPFLNKPFDASRKGVLYNYVQYWWIGLMTEQTGKPSILEKLAAFWQNHFVVAYSAVQEYRYMYRYLSSIRANALGNFRDFVITITKDPGMLVFQNGNLNTKGSPNENYGRELQELFTVGQKDFVGNQNYTEQDVKAAARVLTGWQITNRGVPNSTTFDPVFTLSRHDVSDKAFSSSYNNTIIQGRNSDSAGDAELGDLVNMLLSHSECPKFICRKLYRWFVNPNVTQEIDDQVIVPLAAFFASPSNNFQIVPVIKKMLTSSIFFDPRNVGAIIKAPSEFLIGTLRLFNQPVPDYTVDYVSFRKMMSFVSTRMITLQLDFLDQPTVFGSLPYYQTGFSKNWINESSLGIRGSYMEAIVYPSYKVSTDYTIGVDILGILKAAQPNFSDVSGTPAISCEQVLVTLSRNLFATSLSQGQRDFLIDTIMMMNSSPRTTWVKEWDSYRSVPTDTIRQNTILWRCRALLKYMLTMAEYQVF
ncbi:DUF1800 domain-containing protein [Dyadobacter luticola]|uniref:DUF1800 domain-containing protein n=1 Tax=Dyadobacter luticola TaxID=1979387 RepID=A0A5R9L1Y8_9BACT|nr:DUF1800 domain-containing protein [Dyadobacter luticola]TLV02369.1 DUF1800 domain-containing protein [Dyadobacter luticola]